MSPSALLLCFVGFTAAEIPSHRWETHDTQVPSSAATGPASVTRRTSNDLPIYNDQLNNHPKAQGRGFGYYNTHPVYRYDYGLNERLYPTNGRHNNHNAQPYTTGIYRSYGSGKVTIPFGGTGSVLNTVSHPKVHKGTITARVLPPPLGYKEASPRIVSRSGRHCMGCPQNRAVVASRGNAHVVLPEPCPTMKWKGLSGPRPGSLIPEGTHSLIGRLGYRGKICQYEYEVIVRHCGTFTVESGNANCTIDDAWGSVCTVTCGDGYELVGAPVLECGDDLKWSRHPPQCKKKKGCSLPQTPDNVKIWCQVPDESDLTDEVLPAETYCRFKSDGRQRVITCVDGYWVSKRGRGRRNHRTVKRLKHKKVVKNLKKALN